MKDVEEISARISAQTVYDWDEIRSSIARARGACPDTLLWVVRHGETVCNAEDKISGQIETLLTSNGRAKAASLRSKLPDDVGIVFTSSLKRSVQTMSLALPAGLDYVMHPTSGVLEPYADVVEDHLLAADHDSGLPRCDIFVDARLNEVSFGELEGRSRALLGPYRADSIDITPPGGETYRAFARRVLSGLCDALAVASPADRTILCFAHSGTMRVIRSLTPSYAARDRLFKTKPPSGEFEKYGLREFDVPSYWTAETDAAS